MKRFAIPLTLAVLSAVTAEFLLGDQYLSGTIDWGMQAGMIVLFVLFYGSAAVIIREVARRARRGWPAIILLALAFGLVEEGLVTQTLFNPHYLGLDLLAYGHVPGLGIGVPWTVFVLGLHVVWSISSPIAVAEGLFSTHARRGGEPGGPWLGRRMIILPVVLLVLSALATFAVSYLDGHFLARPWQLAVVAAAAVVVAVLALRVTPTGVSPRGASRSWTAGTMALAVVVGLVTSSGFHLAQQADRWPAWVTVALQLATVAAVIIVARALRLRPLGLATGALITYGWVGMAAALPLGVTGVVEQTLIILALAAVVALAWARSRRGAGVDQEIETDRSYERVVAAQSQAASGASSSHRGPRST